MKNGTAVVGASSMIGARIVELLANIDWEHVRCDITNRQQVLESVSTVEADVIINFAGFTDVTRAWQEAGDRSGQAYALNVVGVENLIEACERSGKTLFHISTDYVFDGQSRNEYVEESPTDASDWYGQTKAMAEEVCLRSPSNPTVLRISSPFQAESPRKEDFFRRTLRLLGEGAELKMFSDTTCTPTFTDDISRVIGALIARPIPGVLQVVGSTQLSPYEYALMIAELAGLSSDLIVPTSVDSYERSGGRPYPRYLRMSNRKLAELGLPQPRRLREALSVALRQVRSTESGS